jgi:hypothetical protein
LATLQQTSLTLWNRTLAINLTGPLLLTQLTSAHMIQQGWGQIVNIAATSGIRAGINRTAYGTLKKLPSSGSPGKWPSNWPGTGSPPTRSPGTASDGDVGRQSQFGHESSL